MRRQPLTLGALSNLSLWDLVSVDTETTGLHWYRDQLFGIALAAWDGQTLRSGYWDTRDTPQILSILKKELPRCRRVVNHSIKFDAHFLLNHGIKIRDDAMECTMVRAALIDEHRFNYDLDSLAKEQVGRGKEVGVYAKLAAMFGGEPTREAQMKNLHRAPSALVSEYATPDPELAILLWLEQEKEIEKQGLGQVWALEKELTPVLVQIERGGVRVDEDKANTSMADIDKLINSKQRELDKLAGGRVNPNSGPQMRKMLGVHIKQVNGSDKWFTDSGLLLPSTDGGQASLGADVLRLLAAQGDTRAGNALAIRKLVKGKGFLKDHILGHSVKGYVYPNYNQTKGDNDLGTGTGRLSINDPALQQIPKRDREVASIVRACFLPDKGEEWNSADWDQFEFRWFAHYAAVPKLTEAYRKNPDTDFHQTTADMTGLPRSARYAGDANAKQINLGLVFGMGQGTMAQEMGLDYDIEYRRGQEFLIAGPKAKEIFEKYHQAVPGVRELLGQASNIAKSRGYVKTVGGRHIRFPGGKFTHKAGGLVFQGSSADSMKRKMIDLYRLGIAKGFRYLLSVHDENNTSTPKGKREAFKKLIKEELEVFDGERCPIKCDIPIKVSVEVGPNWWEACK